MDKCEGEWIRGMANGQGGRRMDKGDGTWKVPATRLAIAKLVWNRVSRCW